MTLFPCYDCKKEISLTATHCPNCGSTKLFSTEELKSAFKNSRNEILKSIPGKNVVQECIDIYKEAFFISILFYFSAFFYVLIFKAVILFFNINISYGAMSVWIILFIIFQHGVVSIIINEKLYEGNDTGIKNNLYLDIDKYIRFFSKKKESSVLSKIEFIEKIIPLLDKEWLRTEIFQLKFSDINRYKEECLSDFDENKKSILFIHFLESLVRVIFYSSIIIFISSLLLIVLYILSIFYYKANIILIAIKLSPIFVNTVFSYCNFLHLVYGISFAIFFLIDIARCTIFGGRNLRYRIDRMNYSDFSCNYQDFSWLYQRLLDINEKIKA